MCLLGISVVFWPSTCFLSVPLQSCNYLCRNARRRKWVSERCSVQNSIRNLTDGTTTNGCRSRNIPHSVSTSIRKVCCPSFPCSVFIMPFKVWRMFAVRDDLRFPSDSLWFVKYPIPSDLICEVGTIMFFLHFFRLQSMLLLRNRVLYMRIRNWWLISPLRCVQCRSVMIIFFSLFFKRSRSMRAVMQGRKLRLFRYARWQSDGRYAVRWNERLHSRKMCGKLI